MEENLQRLKDLQIKINQAVPAYEQLILAAKSIPDPSFIMSILK